MNLNRATTWILALAILLFALLAGTASYHMLLGPGYGGMPFWGARWGEGVPPGSAGGGWRGGHMGWGMMRWHGGYGENSFRQQLCGFLARTQLGANSYDHLFE